MPLPHPARYFPIRGGRYDVAPALRPLGTPFGNGAADEQVFQLDDRFPEFRENKLRCREERPGKHVGFWEYEPEVARAFGRFLTDRLTAEHPEHFSVSDDGGRRTLQCRLTEECLVFDEEMRLRSASGDDLPDYAGSFDALCCQVQEDIAIVSTTLTPTPQRPNTPTPQHPNTSNWLSAYHICAPSHWAPEEKVGRDFATIHAPVPGIEAVNRAARTMVDAMVNRGPFVRFVWGIETTPTLNHHPEPPCGISPGEWAQPRFDPQRECPFVLRVERQVTWGLPEAGAAVFTIRLHHVPATEIRANPAERDALRSAIASMSPESRVYKGVAAHADQLIAWLS